PSARVEVVAAAAETQRLSRLVDGLLALARAEGSRTELTTVDVGTVVAERRAAWEPLASEQGVELRLDGNGHAPLPARAVPGHLEQILDNLLANALDATPPGRAVTLRVERARRGHDGSHVDRGELR